MELRNKIAIITGSAKGIGEAIAIEMANEGAKVILCDTDIDNCEIVADKIKEKGYDALAIECDVTEKKDIERMLKGVLKKYQTIDILVNAASKDTVKPFLKTTQEDWDSTINTNLKGMFLPTRMIGEIMVEQNRGKIISISSIAGDVGFMYASAFGASKAGIINLTKEIAMELAEYNINVNGIISGVFPTVIEESVVEDKKVKKDLIEHIPLRKLGKPKDIAKAAVFLASNKADYITGHNLAVDGGWLTY
jgi:NAD(P)-dependent dehydrogenase (short-subunit alcohol dehydrogenase family)